MSTCVQYYEDNVSRIFLLLCYRNNYFIVKLSSGRLFQIDLQRQFLHNIFAKTYIDFCNAF